ncbi:MAG: tetratricopeptide repeat protein [Gammaproteobacteria bacterium]|nr:tetratricopeptide repeat protein [Gammaproteobacteria bacterium]
MSITKTLNFGIRRWVFLTLVCGSWLIVPETIAQENETPQNMEIVLVEIPMPDLTRLKPEIRNLIEPAIADFEAGRDQLDGVELGYHFARLAMYFHAYQMFDQARAGYRNAVLLDSGNYRWTYLLGIVLAALNQPDRAIAMYKLSLGLEPSNIAARIRLGSQLVRQGAIEDGEVQLQQVLRLDNRNAAALVGMGQIELERKQYQRATSFFLRALDSQPDAGYLHSHLAAAYGAMNDDANADRHLQQVNQRIPVIEDPVLSFVNAHQVAPAEYLRIGRELVRAGKHSAAVKAFQLATAIDPSFQLAFVALAESYRELKQDRAAYAAIDEALKLRPSGPRVNYIKAVWLDQDGSGSIAVGYYRSALNGRPEFARARLLLANTLMRLERFADATVQYQRVVAEDEQNRVARYLLGMAYLVQENCAAAIGPIGDSLALGFVNVRARIVAARLFATCPAASVSQREQGLGYARDLYRELPGADMAVTLAMALAANGDFAEAEEYQAQAMFEAIRNQDAEQQAMLYVDMQRYQQKKPALKSWPDGAEIFLPPGNLRESRSSAGQSETAG